MFFLHVLSILFFSVDINSLSELLNQSTTLSTNQKIEFISEKLLGTPFKESSIGEGKGIDSDPVINLDYVDCVSFVEYIISFVNSKNKSDFEKNIRFLRYADREISFENRMHLPDFQWFPNAQNYGYIEDITALVGKRIVKKIKKSQKNPFYINGQKIDTSKLIVNSIEIEYIPPEDIEGIYNSIPPYSIIRIIREDSFRPYITTHMGIVIQKGKTKYLRHASRHFKQQVMDIPLSIYISTLSKYENWKALGIAIYKINDINKKKANESYQ